MTQEPVTLDSAVVYAAPSKESAAALIESLASAVEQGTMNPLQLLIKLRWAQSVIEGTIQRIESDAVYEADKYGRNEEIRLHGAVCKVKEAGVKYDYSGCGDAVWTRLKENESALADQRKAREKLLQAIKGHQTIIDEETGECMTVHGPAKTSKTVVEVRLK